MLHPEEQSALDAMKRRLDDAADSISGAIAQAKWAKLRVDELEQTLDGHKDIMHELKLEYNVLRAALRKREEVQA